MRNRIFTNKCKTCGKNRHIKLFVDDQNKKLNNCCNICFTKQIKDYIKFKKIDPTKNYTKCKICNKKKRICDMFNIKHNAGYYTGFSLTRCRTCYTQQKSKYKIKNNILNLSNSKEYKRKKGKMYFAYLKLLENAKKDNVKCYITQDQFEALFQKPYDYYDGKKLTFGKRAYRLDRIGLPQFGGDGKRGGDYHINNVVIAHFKHNYTRDLMDLTVAEYRKLYRGYMAFRASGKRNADYLRFKRLKKKLKVKKSI